QRDPQHRAHDQHSDEGDQRGDDGGGQAAGPQSGDLQPRALGAGWGLVEGLGHRRHPWGQGRGGSGVDAFIMADPGSGVAGSSVPAAAGSSGVAALRRAVVVEPRTASAHRRRGSTSTSSALANSVRGTARTAPIVPSTHPQNTSATRVSDTEIPTASPTYLGWITDVSTKFTTVNRTNTPMARPQPPVSRASSTGGTSAIQNPM